MPPPARRKSTSELGLVGAGSGRVAALPSCMEAVAQTTHKSGTSIGLWDHTG